MKGKFIIAFGLVLCLLGTVMSAAGLEPGSSNDPVVTKSYVDSVLEKNTSNKFDAIKIEKGKTLIGGAGCELIVRSGEATALSFYDSGIENGLQDITDGIDLKNNERVPLNHMIVIPRKDTRGIKTVTDVYVMIKGDYDLK